MNTEQLIAEGHSPMSWEEFEEWITANYHSLPKKTQSAFLTLIIMLHHMENDTGARH